MDIASQTCRNSIDSLFSLVVDYVVDNLALYITKNDERLSALPSFIKNRILRRFTTSAYFWRNIDFKVVLSIITNEQTLSINLTSVVIDDEMLSIIQKCKCVRKLYLCSTSTVHITANALVSLLSGCANLNYFILTNSTGVNDAVLECLADNCQHLTTIDIRGDKQVTDVGIKHIAKLKKLTCLNISLTQVTDEGIIALVTGPSGSKLTELWIEMTHATDVGVGSIATHCPNLEVLSFFSRNRQDELTCPMFQSEMKNLKQLTWTVNW